MDSPLLTIHFVVIFQRYQHFNPILIENIHRLSTQHTIRFETAPAEQAQVDWKENIKFLL